MENERDAQLLFENDMVNWLDGWSKAKAGKWVRDTSRGDITLAYIQTVRPLGGRTNARKRLHHVCILTRWIRKKKSG